MPDNAGEGCQYQAQYKAGSESQRILSRQDGPENGQHQSSYDNLGDTIGDERACRPPARNEQYPNAYESSHPNPLAEYHHSGFAYNIEGVLMHLCREDTHQDIKEEKDG